uniref:DM domain-containing protein n=1 Tax=Caenorhabditis japonica TaxID=281687 RepID=A0A8R1I750_CAEJA
MQAHNQSLLEFEAAEDLVLKKKAMKRLTCRKCEGHGLHAILKGHAGACPFKDCACGTCASVMNMRANALIRRFRHRQPDKSMAVVKTLRSKNGNMRLRIVARGDNDENNQTVQNGTLVTYSNDKNGNQTYTTTSTPSSLRRSSIMTNVSEDRDSVISTPVTTSNSTPSVSPPLLALFGDEEAVPVDPVACIRQLLLKQFETSPSSMSSVGLSLLVQLIQPQSLTASTNFLPPMLFPSSLASQIPVPPL